MTSIAPIEQDQDFQGESPAAQDRVQSASLDSQFQAFKQRFNDLLNALKITVRDDNQLADQIVRLRCLHPEVSAAIASAAGWQPKEEVAVATTANIALTGEQTIDGVLTSASRVLVKDQTAGAENGIYLSGPGAWTRTTDADTAKELGYAFVYVVAGPTNSTTTMVLTAEAEDIDLGTTPLVWAQVGGTVGPISIDKGGTGAVTAPAARANLGISAAMDPVVTASTLSAARSNIGISAAMDPVVTASTLTTARAAMDPNQGDWLVKATGSTTARTLAARGKDNINVKDFGATGDGTTNDAAAITAAIASLPAIGGGVYFPNGSYNLGTTTITVPAGVRLYGAGGRGTVLKYGSGSNSYALIIGGDTNNLSYNCSVHDISITLMDKDARGIKMLCTVSASLKNIYIGGNPTVGQTSKGVTIDGGNQSTYLNTLENVYAQHVHVGFELVTSGTINGTQHTFIDCNAFGDKSTDATSIGFFIDTNQGNGSVVIGGNIEECNIGVFSATNAMPVTFTGARFEGNTYDIYTSPTAYAGSRFVACANIAVVYNDSGDDINPARFIACADASYLPINDREASHTAAPTDGTWKRGNIVWNSTPSAGGPPGWQCVTAGTPGTWKAMANLAP